ncbi:hypothetical protein G5V58_11265 [Nocardioides anomalus]|uniref:Mycothiol-dependent maleylpyruvate isomerase metal-binding domain-containing protein n=1 Tax=Nocardioides anomalus TaxID=2712223 RepID=A0A6G6WDM9_9ACTN|nr:maleylpyruvate isomerase N-terminal domain-containing protein [Nocardioides anomalus]QIG43257.1 hypothetical protein G5V58_11265 [Nocardioides anomalus]
MPLSFAHDEAAVALTAQVEAFTAAAGALGDWELLAASRAHGWSRLEVVTHVRLGLEELVLGAVPTDEAPDRDAATYWSGHPDDRDDDPVPHVLWLRRVASAHQRPSAAVRLLERARDGVAAWLRTLPEGVAGFQGGRLSTGDLLATWVVELAVHQLDLDLPDDTPPGLPWTRATLEALAGAPLPAGLDDRTAVLAGLGREPADLGPAYPVSL